MVLVTAPGLPWVWQFLSRGLPGPLFSHLLALCQTPHPCDPAFDASKLALEQEYNSLRLGQENLRWIEETLAIEVLSRHKLSANR